MTNIPSQYLRSRLTKVCVAVIGTTSSEMLEKAAAAAKETPFLEFRLDYLDNPLAALPKIKQFFAENVLVTAVATCRRVPNGGKFKGNLAAETEVLHKAASIGFHLIDVELQSAEALKKAGLQKLREAGAAIIISYHDFAATKDLDGIYARIAPFEPEFIKIVPTAKTLADNITMIRFLERMEDHGNVIGICMGDAGIISRVLGVRAGSIFTFAAASVGEETGPGQIAARTLIETYRIDQVDPATKVYGVAGNPIRSSLSPAMMNAAFRRETVNAVYLALQTSKASDLFKLVNEIPLQGLSVTMPLKQDVMAHLERTDPLSAKIGACNTIVRAADGKLYGFNTDVAGITGPLEKRFPLRDAKILVLGAGGAARAAVFGLRDKGAEVWILNRTPETAQKLARQSGSKTIKREAAAKTHFDAIVNATPVGMSGQKLPQILAAEDLNANYVFDLVYNPVETPLLRAARQKGIPVITGVEMFVQQGARQFEIWTGKPAPEEEMLRVVIHALRQQAELNPEPIEKPIPPPKLAAEKPAPKPATAKPVAKPAAKAASKPVAKPVAKKAPAKPVKKAAKPAPKPAPKKPAPKKPAAKSSKPAKKSPAKKSKGR